MKRLYRRLMSIWRLVRGSDYLLITVHRHRHKYVLNMTDNWDIPGYQMAYRFIDSAIEHLNEIKREVEDEERKDNASVQ